MLQRTFCASGLFLFFNLAAPSVGKRVCARWREAGGNLSCPGLSLSAMYLYNFSLATLSSSIVCSLVVGCSVPGGQGWKALRLPAACQGEEVNKIGQIQTFTKKRVTNASHIWKGSAQGSSMTFSDEAYNSLLRLRLGWSLERHTGTATWKSPHKNEIIQPYKSYIDLPNICRIFGTCQSFLQISEVFETFLTQSVFSTCIKPCIYFLLHSSTSSSAPNAHSASTSCGPCESRDWDSVSLCGFKRGGSQERYL